MHHTEISIPYLSSCVHYKTDYVQQRIRLGQLHSPILHTAVEDYCNFDGAPYIPHHTTAYILTMMTNATSLHQLKFSHKICTDILMILQSGSTNIKHLTVTEKLPHYQNT